MRNIRNGHRQEAWNAIDFCAGESRLGSWNAGLKMTAGMAALMICIAADRPAVSLFTIVSMALVTTAGGGLSLRRYLTFLAIPLTFMILGTAAIAVGVAKEPAGDYYIRLHWFCLYVTGAGLWQAFGLIMKALGAVSAMYGFVLSTTAGEMIGVLRKIHVPGLIIELMYLIYRFIFVLYDTHGQMKRAAQSRGGYCDFKTSCRTFGNVAGNLLVFAMRRSGTYYDALLSRCYDGKLCFLEEEKEVKGRQAAAVAGYLAVMAVVWLVSV